jgi:hypothetical protein
MGSHLGLGQVDPSRRQGRANGLPRPDHRGGETSAVGSSRSHYLASATLLPRNAMIKAVGRKMSSAEIARKFGTSPELVDYRLKRLGLWREYVGKKVALSSN